jgi:asparagine synthase (glutamine-hydrolysing)
MGFNLIFSGLGGDEAHCGEIEEYLYYFADLKFLELEEKFNEDLVGWKKYHSTKEYPKNKKILNIFFNSQINFSKQGEVLLNNERYEYNFDILNRDIEINDIIKPKLRNPFKSYLLNKLYQDLYFEAIPVVLKAEMASARSAKIPTVYPYLDPNIMNFSFSLPLKFRYNNGISKYFLREITKNIVPNTARKNYLKKGWNAPFDQWLRKKIKSEILDLINSQDARNRGIYNLTAIKKKLDQHLKNEKNYAMLLWQFLSYEKWYQSWK